MRTSLKDIALRVNVSTTTVSWCLSGQGDSKGISKDTQARILSCAKELDYQPNLLARSLNTGYSSILGLIIPDITDSFYGAIARQIELEAERKGYTLMICSSLYNIERERKMLSMLQSKQVDGIILTPTFRAEDGKGVLTASDSPLVTIDQILPLDAVNSIIVDNQEATERIITNMIAQGARHVSLVSANPDQFTIKERRKGYERALRKAGLPIQESLIANIPFDTYREDLFGALDRVLSENPEVDSFFFTSHIIALEAFRYFYERGINVNERYQLGCFHGYNSFKAFAPDIQVAWMPVREIGSEAVRIITDQIECKKQKRAHTPEHIVLPCS